MYSVMRKNVMEYSYRQVLKYKMYSGYDYYPLYEIMMSSLQVIKGKVKRFDDLYSIRQILPNSGGNKSLQFRELYLLDDFSNNYSFFKSLIIKNLSNSYKSDDIKSKIIEIDFYFNNFYKSRLMISPNSWYYPSNDTLSNDKNYDIKSSINNNSYLFNLLKRYFYVLKSFFLSFRVQKRLNIYVPKWWWFFYKTDY